MPVKMAAREATQVAPGQKVTFKFTAVGVSEGDHVVTTNLEHNSVIRPINQLVRDHGVEATFVEETGHVAKAILETSVNYGCDLVIMGGYGFSPLLEIAFGSMVDQVLLSAQIPVLICR